MTRVNENYLKLPGSYLFSTIGKKRKSYAEAHPDSNIISLGIGDVTQPLAPAIIEALHKSVDEMAHAETFHGYAPDLGYEFLRDAIAKNDYQDRDCEVYADEIFVSDGAKCDCGNIQEIFSADAKIAVCDPVYPVYVDTNVMAGRTGEYDPKSETWSNVIYMPCVAANNFAPELPSASRTIRRVQRLPKHSFRNGLIMQTVPAPSSFMMLLTKHIFQKKIFHIRFMNVKGREPVRSRCIPSPRMQALPACVWDIRLFRRN